MNGSSRRDNDDNMPIIGIPAEIITHITRQIEMGERERGGERERDRETSLTRLGGRDLPGVYGGNDQHLPLPHDAVDLLVLIRDYERLQALSEFRRRVIR